jgi:hypothetical protein
MSHNVNSLEVDNVSEAHQLIFVRIPSWEFPGLMEPLDRLTHLSIG